MKELKKSYELQYPFCDVRESAITEVMLRFLLSFLQLPDDLAGRSLHQEAFHTIFSRGELIFENYLRMRKRTVF
jgi:hypothetical protein